MTAPSITQANLDALEQAIVSGVLSVAYKDRTVTYRSMSELIRARDLAKRLLGQIPNTPARFRASYDKEV